MRNAASTSAVRRSRRADSRRAPRSTAIRRTEGSARRIAANTPTVASAVFTRKNTEDSGRTNPSPTVNHSAAVISRPCRSARPARRSIALTASPSTKSPPATPAAPKLA
ncbi:hypothetical protein [Acuticoccus sp. I52.16.1]|uniref:hypothetical protein n=1 Tax=Acuticoccus sp. I52.16.1 TaxID=2928472 RepID=UPI001FD00BFA|nr:hypothetical protein [Acuticoccus sp. I52.16.1]UOM37212.1 hypothetical protein MRB58_23915 [Acuticoccus sp. I52.16.1]